MKYKVRLQANKYLPHQRFNFYKDMGKPSKFNDETARIILDAKMAGDTNIHACKKAGISDETLRLWKRDNLDFLEAFNNAEKEGARKYKANLLATAKRSLIEVLSGYEYEEVRTEYENDSRGNPKIKKQVNVQKRVGPSVNALIFVLTNLEPETWKNRQTTDINAKTEGVTDVSLANVPDDLLGKVIDAIKKK